MCVVSLFFVLVVSLRSYFVIVIFVFFFKQKTAYEMRISDWSSDVCSSDLATAENVQFPQPPGQPILLWLTMDNPADGGWIRAKGPLQLSPLALDLDLRVGPLALAPLAAALRRQAPTPLPDGLLGLPRRVNVSRQGRPQLGRAALREKIL